MKIKFLLAVLALLALLASCSAGIATAQDGGVLHLVFLPFLSRPDTCPTGNVVISEVGRNIWEGNQIDLTTLPDHMPCTAYIAHGDVAGDGMCKIWGWHSQFDPARPPLSSSTWTLLHVSGSEAEINAVMANLQTQLGGSNACLTAWMDGQTGTNPDPVP